MEAAIRAPSGLNVTPVEAWPSSLTLPLVRDLVSEIVLVDEAHLERAVYAYLTLQKTMAEGAGAAGLAAMLVKPERFRGRKVGLILCGGNIDPRILASVMVRELEREDRIVSFRLAIPDRPGILGQIATQYETKLRVGLLDSDANPELVQEYSVMGLPTMILFVDGSPVERIVGYHPRERIEAKLQPHLAKQQA